MRRCLGAVAAPLLLLACCGVWRLGGMLIEWLELQALDLPARFCLLFLFLTGMEAGIARLPGRPRDEG